MIEANCNLPSGFRKVYESYNQLHDRYLINISMGNIGQYVLKYSKKGLITVQIEFDAVHDLNANNMNLLLIYTDVVEFTVNYSTKDLHIPPINPTGFCRCYESKFTSESGLIRHDMYFEAGSSISILFKKIEYKKLRNLFG